MVRKYPADQLILTKRDISGEEHEIYIENGERVMHKLDTYTNEDKSAVVFWYPKHKMYLVRFYFQERFQHEFFYEIKTQARNVANIFVNDITVEEDDEGFIVGDDSSDWLI